MPTQQPHYQLLAYLDSSQTLRIETFSAKRLARLSLSKTSSHIFLVQKQELAHGSSGKTFLVDVVNTEHKKIIKARWIAKIGSIAKQSMPAVIKETHFFNKHHGKRSAVCGAFNHPENGKSFFILEKHLPGQSLLKLLSNKALSSTHKLQAVLVALQAMQRLHQQGIIHGDFNPNNVLIVSDQAGNPQSAAIIDFGYSAKLGEKLKPIPGDWFTAERQESAVIAEPHHDIYPIAWAAWRHGNIELKETGAIVFKFTSAEQRVFTVERAIAALKQQLMKQLFTELMPAELPATPKNSTALLLSMQDIIAQVQQAKTTPYTCKAFTVPTNYRTRCEALKPSQEKPFHSLTSEPTAERGLMCTPPATLAAGPASFYGQTPRPISANGPSPTSQASMSQATTRKKTKTSRARPKFSPLRLARRC